MSRKKSMQPVLLRPEQVGELQRIREREAQKSVLGIRPSLHEVARQLIDRAIEMESKK
ncbi:hypothetical protein RLV03_003556 [Salmonella enterica subsp. enterica serovar Benin]|nr:hypothetical protein [Salmonella enterica]ELD8109576.1 hypothetical protein [Salmonella enterica subsp. enterica serovar Benin]EHX7748732.1 hypothetical protein [Salmonella enterica]EIW3444976.1 hypothetical protein [Salmonella enterica]EIZ5130354.1 hypothetical protein [Salmonella enterica]